MARRQQEQATNAAEMPDSSAPEDRTRSTVEVEETKDVPETGSEDGQPPSLDEIRLQAYYRYL